MAIEIGFTYVRPFLWLLFDIYFKKLKLNVYLFCENKNS